MNVHLKSQKSQDSLPYDNGRFNHQKVVLNTSFGHALRMTWKFMFGGKHRTPSVPLPSIPATHKCNSSSGLSATWLGHSSLFIEIDGQRLLFDPVFEKRISLLGPTRFKGELPLTVDRLPHLDAVIISHDHYDHLNKWSIRQLAPKTDVFIVPVAVGAHLVKWGIPRDKVRELDWWAEHALGSDLMVAATPAQHFSGRGLFDRNRTLWASWVVKTSNHSIYFSGDSGYFYGFRQIGEKYGPFDMTFMECGAYDRMWHGVHMMPEETVRAHQDLGGEILLPIHCATFNLALHPWYEPMERISKAAQQAGVQLALPVMGGTTHYGTPAANAKWWRPQGAEK